jgi:hypothetical protein
MLAAVLAGAIALAGSAGVLAQDATPRAASPFASLGLPELTITATEASLAVDQTEIPAGRYLIRLDNASGNPMFSTGFVQLTGDLTLDDLSFADEMASGTPMPEAGPDPSAFAFLYETTIVPGASGHSPEVVVDLSAGDYGVWADDPTSAIAAVPLHVTGDPSAAISGPEPVAAATLVEEGKAGEHYAFRLDGELKAGPRIVKVVNASDQPHFAEAWQYPEPITSEQVMSSMLFDPSSGATPSPDMLDFEKISFAGWAATQSSGTTQWVVMNLAPGQVVVACWIPDPAAQGLPHAMEGMLQIFDVG